MQLGGRKRIWAVFALGFAVAETSTASEFFSADVRAAGMGGTGVAAASPSSAPFFNPALLSSPAGNRHLQFSLGFGATANNLNNLQDRIDNVQDHVDLSDAALQRSQNVEQNLENSVNRFGNNPTQQNLDAVLNNANEMADTLDLLVRRIGVVRRNLNHLDGERFHADGGGSFSGGVGGDILGVGAYYNATVYGSAGIDLSAEDAAFLHDVYQTVKNVDEATHQLLDVNCLADDVCRNSARDKLNINTFGDFPATSTGSGAGALVREYGISFSHQFVLADHPLSVGLTPKKVTVKISGVHNTVRHFESSDLNDDLYSTEASATDYDLGLAYRLNDNWQAGLVGKYLRGNSFTQEVGVQGRTIEQRFDLKSQWRGGLAYLQERYTLTADLDLTENSGVDDANTTRFLGLGAEYDLVWLQLRAGYRFNVANSQVGDIFTVGVGLGPMNLAAVRSAEDIGYYFLLTLGW